jgi:hypothetical protein
VLQWKTIADFVEPDWERVGTAAEPALFWRPKKGATFGFVRDGELFDNKWIYVSDANKVSHFVLITGPDESSVTRS